MAALNAQFSGILPLRAATTTLETSPQSPNPSLNLALPRGKTLQIETRRLSSIGLRLGFDLLPSFDKITEYNMSKNGLSVHAAWTRRSSGEGPRKSTKSFKQRTEKYMKPFILDIFISSKYVHAKVMHRVTSKVVSVATTNSKDLRNSLVSLTDVNACKTVGKLIADRSKEADVYAVTFQLRKGEKLEGKLAAVLDTVVENGITLV
ncbi:hypothetical protein O6H91_07G105900 [Diphasiastrum complanatum]|uniref:Uncharacterized protein n=1 Tax=Diphasiastrum complanatum TaxID=34168 RepID=A0ACC2D8N5_DIPCM|nr:hypothetical protein O6H91_07G105900 [Diphasiastrum complanatum]